MDHRRRAGRLLQGRAPKESGGGCQFEYDALQRPSRSYVQGKELNASIAHYFASERAR
jgi:hypothetical protein